jgi:hypothetical protein
MRRVGGVHERIQDSGSKWATNLAGLGLDKRSAWKAHERQYLIYFQSIRSGFCRWIWGEQMPSLEWTESILWG